MKNDRLHTSAFDTELAELFRELPEYPLPSGLETRILREATLRLARRQKQLKFALWIALGGTPPVLLGCAVFFLLRSELLPAFPSLSSLLPASGSESGENPYPFWGMIGLEALILLVGQQYLFRRLRKQTKNKD